MRGGTSAGAGRTIAATTRRSPGWGIWNWAFTRRCVIRDGSAGVQAAMKAVMSLKNAMVMQVMVFNMTWLLSRD
jgi:hypothetical protein